MGPPSSTSSVRKSVESSEERGNFFKASDQQMNEHFKRLTLSLNRFFKKEIFVGVVQVSLKTLTCFSDMQSKKRKDQSGGGTSNEEAAGSSTAEKRSRRGDKELPTSPVTPPSKRDKKSDRKRVSMVICDVKRIDNHFTIVCLGSG